MEIAMYARVSTGRQQQAHTIEQQLERLQQEVQKQSDWHLSPEHIYIDDGYSGAQLNRPGLDRLRDRAAMAAFQLVLIAAPDRLARKYVHQVLLINELQELGCAVEFIERPMSDDPHDQLLLQIRGAVAEYERSLIADRMRRGRLAKLRSGTLLPWTTAPYGYLLDVEHPRDPNRVQIDPVKAEIIRQIFAWYTDPQQPLSLYEVAKRLSADQILTPKGNVRWNVASIRGILRNPAYAGTAYSGRTRPVPAQRRKSALQPVGSGQSSQPTDPDEWIAIAVPAIIDVDTFDLAQVRLDQNKQMARRNNTSHDYLLRGLVSCAQCQLACTGRMVHPGYSYYVCRGRTDALRLAIGERCTARYIPAAQLDELVWQDLSQILADPTLISHELQRAQAGEWLPQALQARRRTLEQAQAQVQRQQARLLEVYLAEIIGRDEFERKRQELAQTLDGLTVQLRQLQAQLKQQIDAATFAMGIENFCQRVRPTLESLSFAQRRQLIELLIDRVIVDDDQVEIRYAIPTSPKGEIHPFCHLRLDYFDGKSPQVHARQINQRHGGGTGPEQIERTLEAGCAVRLEKLDTQQHPHQEGQLVEMQSFPSPQTHSLAQKRAFLDLVGSSPGRRKLELASMDARSPPLPRLPFRWFLVQIAVATQAHQGVEVLHRQKDSQKNGVAVQRVRHDHFGTISPFRQRSCLFGSDCAVCCLCRDPPHILGHTPGRTPLDQPGYPGIAMDHLGGRIPSFLGPHSVLKCLGLWHRIVCTIHRVDFEPGDRFRIFWLIPVQHPTQLGKQNAPHLQ